MATTLKQIQAQKQKLAPKQVLNARLLQLNIVNLEQTILKELEQNPTLEQVDSDQEQIPDSEEINPIEDMDVSVEDMYSNESNYYINEQNKEIPIPDQNTFSEKLIDQLQYIELDANEREVAEEIIWNTNERGYLDTDLVLIADRYNLLEEEIEPILYKVQRLEPKGIGSRNLKECLMIQLEDKKTSLPYSIINKSFDDFIGRVDHKDINKLQLEGLTKSGVFDEFDPDRNKILNSIPKIIQHIKNTNDDKKNNQTSLFENQINLVNNFEFLPSTPWKQKELLAEEFKSLGFYISNHPLNEYEEIFKQLNIISYNEFYLNDNGDGLVAGTIMSIQEKKSSKGTPYAIVKFSDKKGEFELFLFSEILVANRDKLKESESVVLTLQKDKITGENSRKRVNVRKISSLENLISEPFSNVTIELKENFKIKEIKEILACNGNTKINLLINGKKQKARYILQNNRKFNIKHLKALKAKEYVVKISE